MVVSTLSGTREQAGEISIKVKFTRVGGKKVRSNKDYKIISAKAKFDLLPNDNPFNCDIAPEDIPAEYYHELSFRLVRIKINKKGEDGKEEFEMLITNLPVDIFPPRVLKIIYHLRWGIESAYRELKYDEKAIFFHSKKKNSYSKSCTSLFPYIILLPISVPSRGISWFLLRRNHQRKRQSMNMQSIMPRHRT